MRFLLTLVVLLTFAAPAFAQAPPDVLVRTDGTTVRGTVLETAPGESVTFMDYSGETLVVPWDEVEYAGSVDEREGTQSSAPASDEVVVEFSANVSPVQYSYVAGTMTAVSSTGATAVAVSFRPLCTAPCTMSLEPGEYTMAAQYRNRRLAAAIDKQPLVLTADSHVHGEYVDRRTGRIVGWVVGVTGAVVAGVGAIPFDRGEFGSAEYSSLNWALIGTGGALAIGGWVTHMTHPDRVRYTVTSPD